MEAANAISKALNVENGQFFITDGEALPSAPAKDEQPFKEITIDYSGPELQISKKLVADLWKAPDKPW